VTTIKAPIRNQRLEFDAPADWPDCTQVVIQPVEQSPAGDADVMSLKEIARTLAVMDQLEPLDMTEAERAAWEAEQQARPSVLRPRSVWMPIKH
jgi:hypothetical protein